MKPITLLTLLLPLGLMAADPSAFRILPLDTKAGLAVMDLKPEELSVKVDDQARKVLRIEAPRADVPVRWILVFEPIREARYRTLAFLSATEFLRKVPDGDEVLLVVRNKESFQAMGPAFSLNRAEWAKQMAQIPELLPEFLTSPVKEGGTTLVLDDRGTHPAGDALAGKKELDALSARILKEKDKFSKGQVERSTAAWATGPNEVIIIQKEAKSLGTLLGDLAKLGGDKQVVLFSRTIADELIRPEYGTDKWDTKEFSPTNKNARVTNTNQTLLVADVRNARESMKGALVRKDLILHSVAGSGTHIIGFCGELAQSTGGQAVTFMNGLEEKLPGLLLSYRDCVQVTLEPAEGKTGSMAITSTRPNLKIYHPTLQ